MLRSINPISPPLSLTSFFVTVGAIFALLF